MPAPSVDGPAPITGLNLFKLLDAFQSVLSRAKATIDHQIDFERFSITDRINELSDILRVRPRLSFEELFEDHRSRAELIVTFLALLEMTRLRLTRLYQDGPLELIFIELSVSDEETAASEAPPADNALDADSAGASVEDGGLEESSGEDDDVPPDAER
jgi:segregation and condensation protein A